MAVTGDGAEQEAPPALGLVVAAEGLGEARHLGGVRGQAIVGLLEDAVVAFAGAVELGLRATSADGAFGPAVAGVELGEALERAGGGRVDLDEALELPALGAESRRPGGRARRADSRTSASVYRRAGR